MNMYQVGQRIFVKQLHHQHSIDKKQAFLGRVVIVVSSKIYKSGTRFFLRLAASPNRTIPELIKQPKLASGELQT